jgi:hypothetical protein
MSDELSRSNHRRRTRRQNGKDERKGVRCESPQGWEESIQGAAFASALLPGRLSCVREGDWASRAAMKLTGWDGNSNGDGRGHQGEGTHDDDDGRVDTGGAGLVGRW